MSQRVVSLISSATEIVVALGLGDLLVGRSHECDFPESIRGLPVCSEPRIDVNASSAEIDRQVRAAVGDALSIYKVDAALLNELQPTHVITQTQCEVCAVSLKDVEQALCQMVSSQPRIIAHEPNSLDDIWKDIQRTADELGHPERGVELVSSLQNRLQAIRVAGESRGHRPKILCLEWLSPMMSAGNWVPELIEIAGGKSLLSTPGQHSPYFSWMDLLQANPDVILMMPCGFDIPRTVSELGVLFDAPEWFELRAVQQGRVYVADGNQFFNRPGPRIVESAEILAEVLFDPGHQRLDARHHGTGWLRLEEC